MTKKQITELVRKWSKRLGLNHYDITIYTPTNDDGEYAGSCKATPEYLRATIRINLSEPEDEIENTILHELLHIVMWKLDKRITVKYAQGDEVMLEIIEDEVDTIITTLTRAFLR